ncbi:hypothetical protein [Streptomyces litchfieldiae]|uniref:Antitoxin n=1 Tax=Streptomyces litchfieldiae TaxID=3075543 RepID=A0ABU2N0T0_9ACTN|nr:hypothetical protein [Streptomyces sp. DSM 44938]MDT0347490.1 hypothetical protein [Streptomyces sp. DSM 44938]
MGFFSRKKTGDSSAPADPKLVELGRDYAIARRHRDRRQMNRIIRTVEREHGIAEADWSAFQQGQDAYDSIPPIPRARGRNRRKR